MNKKKDILTIRLEQTIKDLIHNYVDDKYMELNERHRERMKDMTIEVYYYITYKQRDIWTSIHTKDLLRFRFDINTKEIRRTLHYTDFLDILLDLQFIRRNDYYIYNKNNNNNIQTRTKEYMINDLEYIKDTILLEYELDIKRAHRDEINKGINEWLEELPPTHHQHIKHIYKASYNENEVYDYMIRNKGNYTNKNKLITTTTIQNYMNYVSRLNKQIFNFKITKEGRFYTPITIQPSFIRRFLTIDDETLIELDIKNSNPLFLTKYIKNEDFNKAVSTGDPDKEFYNILLNDMNKIKEEENKPKVSRQQIKELTMKYIFFNKRPLKSGLLFNILEKNFKGFIYELNELKIKLDKEGIGLWTPLQRDESDLMLIRLMEESDKRDLTYLGMIDGILIKRGDKNIFLDILTNLFNEQGLTPTIVMSDEENDIKEIYEIKENKILQIN